MQLDRADAASASGGAPVARGASATLKRSIGTFQLTMFGVGAAVGTGILLILSQAVPEAGPAVAVSFLIAGIAAGLAALCGELMATVVAACLLLEYGVSTAAVSVGWSRYVNKLTDNLLAPVRSTRLPSLGSMNLRYAYSMK